MLSRIVVHYGEIGTKGGNRQVFEGSLRRNILSALGPLGEVRVRMVDNRFFVLLDDEKVPEAKLRLAKVFGIVWFAQVEAVPLVLRRDTGDRDPGARRGLRRRRASGSA